MVVEVGDEIREEINQRVRTLMQICKDAHIEGLQEMVPTYRSLLIYYDPAVVTFSALKEKILGLLESTSEEDLPPPRLVHIPTLYGGEMGPDLEDVAEYNNLPVKEVIRIHTSTNYLVYMLGFTPGFCYLGGMSKKIAMPRLENPRVKIPAGSVAIAGTQTGIYPVDSPGGWRLIGRTPMKIYDPYAQEPILLRAGDYLKFDSISGEEYQDILTKAAESRYRPTIKEVVK